MAVYYNIGTTMAKMAFSTFARWNVDGREAVPPKGPLIIVPNHLSNADPPILVASIPRRLHFMAKRSLFANPVASNLLTSVGVYPINRDGLDMAALRWNLSLLSRDQAIVLFPEGTRSPDARMNRGMPGIAYVAAKSQAPILPVGITGSQNIPGFWRIAFPFCGINVTIGEPFSLPVIEGKISRPVLEHMTDMIMYRVANLLPPEYRGHYSTETIESRDNPIPLDAH